MEHSANAVDAAALISYSQYDEIRNAIVIRAATSTRVLEHYRNSKLLEYFFTTRVLVAFYFRLQIFISGCSFCSQLMNCWILWKLGASRFHSVHLPAWK